MKDRDVLKHLIETNNLKKVDIAAALGLTPQAFNGRLNNNKNLQTNKMIEILDVLGYDLVVVPKAAKVPNGSYVLDKE